MKINKIIGFAVIAAAGGFASVANATNTFASTVTNFDLQHGFWIDQNSSGDNTLTPTLNASTPGDFTQTLTFTTAVPGNYDFSLRTNSNISSFGWSLDAAPITYASGSGAFTSGQSGAALFNLTSGTHTLVVSGVFNYSAVPGAQSATAEYTGQLVTAAVPEPETFAMLLAGLGVVGMVSRRRKQGGAVLA